MSQNTYSLAEAAELVGYSTRTLRRAIDAGELLAARQAAGSIRISRAELAKWWRNRGGGELFEEASPEKIKAFTDATMSALRKLIDELDEDATDENG